MQAIITKYLPATITKPARIKATCECGSITINYPCWLSGDAVHVEAARALVDKFVDEDEKRHGHHISQWRAHRVCGQLPNGDYAHIFLS